MPVAIEPEENITFFYSKELFKKLLTEYIEQNEIDKNRKITFLIHDSTGKTYKTTSPLKAKEYL